MIKIQNEIYNFTFTMYVYLMKKTTFNENNVHNM